MIMANGCIEKYLNATRIAAYIYSTGTQAGSGKQNVLEISKMKMNLWYFCRRQYIVYYVNRADTVLG